MNTIAWRLVLCPLKKKINWSHLKYKWKVSEITAYDMDGFYNHIILIVQKLSLGEYLMLSYELDAYQVSFIDQYGDQRK